MKAGRPKSKEESTAAVSTRIPVSVLAKLKTMARNDKRSLSSLLRILIERSQEKETPQ